MSNKTKPNKVQFAKESLLIKDMFQVSTIIYHLEICKIFDPGRKLKYSKVFYKKIHHKNDNLKLRLYTLRRQIIVNSIKIY